jgi:heme-degrading monooxygenase HmoA
VSGGFVSDGVVTVFRSRLRESSREEYSQEAARMDELARSMPGFVDAKTFVADDGERVTIVTFSDRASHDEWRDHPEHRRAQRRGVDEFYDEWRIQVADVTSTRGWERSRN